MRQAPPRILYIATWTLLIGVLDSLLWLIITPPAAYAHYQPWFQAAFTLVLGSIFIACGLFFDSWFATIMGVGLQQEKRTGMWLEDRETWVIPHFDTVSEPCLRAHFTLPLTSEIRSKEESPWRFADSIKMRVSRRMLEFT
jgi:hypothetical protein